MDNTIQIYRTRSTDFTSPTQVPLLGLKIKYSPWSHSQPSVLMNRASVSYWPTNLGFSFQRCKRVCVRRLLHKIELQVISQISQLPLLNSCCCRIQGHYLKWPFLLYLLFITTVNMNYLPVSSLSFQ